MNYIKKENIYKITKNLKFVNTFYTFKYLNIQFNIKLKFKYIQMRAHHKNLNNVEVVISN